MRKPRILVCDDEEGIRESLDLMLGKDYQLEFATDGEEAIRIASERPFNLALLDIKMPRVNGLEVLKWFRDNRPAVRVLMLTAYQSVEMARQALGQGAVDYLPKPFEQSELKSTIARALARPTTAKKTSAT